MTQQLLVSVLYILGGFALLVYVLTVGYTESNRDLIMMVAGFAISALTSILGYWIGTSLSSSKKTELMVGHEAGRK